MFDSLPFFIFEDNAYFCMNNLCDVPNFFYDLFCLFFQVVAIVISQENESMNLILETFFPFFNWRVEQNRPELPKSDFESWTGKFAASPGI